MKQQGKRYKLAETPNEGGIDVIVTDRDAFILDPVTGALVGVLNTQTAGKLVRTRSARAMNAAEVELVPATGQTSAHLVIDGVPWLLGADIEGRLTFGKPDEDAAARAPEADGDTLAQVEEISQTEKEEDGLGADDAIDAADEAPPPEEGGGDLGGGDLPGDADGSDGLAGDGETAAPPAVQPDVVTARPAMITFGRPRNPTTNDER